jgi:hypothetical protein
MTRRKRVDTKITSDEYYRSQAEPYWMQDARIAQRKIAAQIEAIRASKPKGRSGG